MGQNRIAPDRDKRAAAAVRAVCSRHMLSDHFRNFYQMITHQIEEW
jgi:hypothetical protein